MSPELEKIHRDIDNSIIHEAAMLAGILEGNELLNRSCFDVSCLILREMRAETEPARLARRIASHYRMPAPGALVDCQGAE